MPRVRMCGVQWAATTEGPHLFDPNWRCSNSATHVGIAVDMLDNIPAYYFCCERCKNLCKDMPHWGFVEIPEQYRR